MFPSNGKLCHKKPVHEPGKHSQQIKQVSNANAKESTCKHPMLRCFCNTLCNQHGDIIASPRRAAIATCLQTENKIEHAEHGYKREPRIQTQTNLNIRTAHPKINAKRCLRMTNGLRPDHASNWCADKWRQKICKQTVQWRQAQRNASQHLKTHTT